VATLWLGERHNFRTTLTHTELLEIKPSLETSVGSTCCYAPEGARRFENTLVSAAAVEANDRVGYK
jgi:hypothetical protein